VRPVYLLDTNVVSEPLKPRPNPTVLERMSEYQEMTAIASPVWHELLFGLSRLPEGARRRRVQAYLYDVIAPSLPVIPYDGPAAALHATMRAEAEIAGQPLSFVDGMIAAIARAHNLLIVTRNTSHFDRIAGVPVEDWFTSPG
jgi:tRNA(fMet)-specific endonuclease VapC